MLREATAAVMQFCRAHPEFRFKEGHPGAKDQLGGGTNFVLWGAHGGEAVVYKYYQSDWGAKRYRNELACLEHFAATGWVPRVHAVEPETLIVMTCLAGRWIQEEVDSGELDAESIHRLGVQLGRAVGLLVDLEVPPSANDYSIMRDYEIIPWRSDLEEAVRFYTELCWRDRGNSRQVPIRFTARRRPSWRPRLSGFQASATLSTMRIFTASLTKESCRASSTWRWRGSVRN